VSDTDALASQLLHLLDELRLAGVTSRIQEPRDPDYWPHTHAARGVLAIVRRRDDLSVETAKRIACLLYESQRAMAELGMAEPRIRREEKSRVLASVADDIRGLTRHGDEAYEELANMYSSGRMPGYEEVSR